MKRKLLLLIFAAIVSATVVNADEYVPLVREGVEWGYVDYYSDTDSPYGRMNYYCLQFKGTIDIDGVTYHKLYKYSNFLLPNTKY